MVIVRDGVGCFFSDEFARDNVRALISYLSVECFYSYLLFILFHFYFLSLYCAFLFCTYLEHNL